MSTTSELETKEFASGMDKKKIDEEIIDLKLEETILENIRKELLQRSQKEVISNSPQIFVRTFRIIKKTQGLEDVSVDLAFRAFIQVLQQHTDIRSNTITDLIQFNDEYQNLFKQEKPLKDKPKSRVGKPMNDQEKEKLKVDNVQDEIIHNFLTLKLNEVRFKVKGSSKIHQSRRCPALAHVVSDRLEVKLFESDPHSSICKRCFLEPDESKFPLSAFMFENPKKTTLLKTFDSFIKSKPEMHTNKSIASVETGEQDQESSKKPKQDDPGDEEEEEEDTKLKGEETSVENSKETMLSLLKPKPQLQMNKSIANVENGEQDQQSAKTKNEYASDDDDEEEETKTQPEGTSASAHSPNSLIDKIRVMVSKLRVDGSQETDPVKRLSEALFSKQWDDVAVLVKVMKKRNLLIHDQELLGKIKEFIKQSSDIPSPLLFRCLHILCVSGGIDNQDWIFWIRKLLSTINQDQSLFIQVSDVFYSWFSAFYYDYYCKDKSSTDAKAVLANFNAVYSHILEVRDNGSWLDDHMEYEKRDYRKNWILFALDFASGFIHEKEYEKILLSIIDACLDDNISDESVGCFTALGYWYYENERFDKSKEILSIGKQLASKFRMSIIQIDSILKLMEQKEPLSSSPVHDSVYSQAFPSIKPFLDFVFEEGGFLVVYGTEKDKLMECKHFKELKPAKTQPFCRILGISELFRNEMELPLLLESGFYYPGMQITSDTYFGGSTPDAGYKGSILVMMMA